MVNKSLLGILSVIVPIIAFIYTIYSNYKLYKKNEEQAKEIQKINKINKFIYIIKSDFEEYINDMDLEYYKVKIYKTGRNYSTLTGVRNTLIDATELYCNRIEKILTSFETLKSDINKSYDIYQSKLNTIKLYLNRLSNINYIKCTYSILEYLKSILDYCHTITSSIYFEINNNDINLIYIEELYEKIDNIRKELDKIL